MADISLTNATVFPEDAGTGAPTSEDKGDFVSAGHLGTLTLNRAANSFVGSGADFTFNTDNTLLTVSKTIAFIRFEGDIQVQDESGSYTEPWDYPMMFMVVFPTEDSIPVTGGGVNDIYLWIDRGEENGAYLRIGQNVATPDGPSVQLGSVDPRDGTTSKTNRGETAGITDADILEAVNTDADHGTTAQHNYTTSADLEQGGSDQLNVTGLAGDLADPQDPTAHDHSGEALGATSPLTSLSSESVNDISYATPGDDLPAAAAALSAGEELVIVGDHTINQTISPPDGTTITVLGTVKMADGVSEHIIGRDTNPTDITIQGSGTLVGNRDTVSQLAGGIWMRENPQNIHIRDIEVMNTHNALCTVGRAGFAGSNVRINNVYFHDSGKAGQNADAIFLEADDVVVSDSILLNMTDTAVACGNCAHVTVTGNIMFNSNTHNTNRKPAAQMIAVGSQSKAVIANIVGNIAGNPGTGKNIIEEFATTNGRKVSIASNYLFGTHDRGVQLLADAQDCIVTGNIIENSSGDGIFVEGGNVINNVINSVGNNGITTPAGGSSNIRIQGNRIKLPGGNGIASNATGGMIRGNLIEGASSQGIVVNSSKNVISGNKTLNNTNNGIQITSGQTDTVVNANFSQDNGGSGIGLGGSNDYNIVTHNNLRNNTGTNLSGTPGTNSIVKDNIT